jgi:ATP-binding cassette subfamily B protein
MPGSALSSAFFARWRSRTRGSGADEGVRPTLDLKDISWTLAQAGDAMKALSDRTAALPEAPREIMTGNRDAARTWISSTAARLNLDTEPEPVRYRELPMVLGQGIALLEIQIEGHIRLLAIDGRRRRKLALLAPGGRTVRVTGVELRSAIAAALESKLAEPLDSILNDVGLAGPARIKVLQSMLEERLGGIHIAHVWPLQASLSAGLWAEARRAGLPRQLVAFTLAYAVEYVLWIVSWVLVGHWALEGRFDSGWLLGWALLLITIVPIHMLASWKQAKLAISCGWVMMRLLLEGSFHLNPEEVRYQGVGQLLGRVLESESLQSLALTGGLSTLVSLIQLVVAVVLLAAFVNAPWLALALVGWIAVTAGLGLLYYRRRRQWTTARLQVTQETIERMVGHRTRLVQQPSEKWHEGEDDLLARYVKQSKIMDRTSIACMALVPRGWLIVGIAVMAYGVVTGSQSSGILAAQLGAILLAFNSLQGLSAAFAALAGAGIAAERAGDFLKAVTRVEPSGDPAIAVAAASPSSGKLLQMRDITFRYPHRAADAIQHNFVEIGEGQRVLLEGSSGSGKSTWVALASGVRTPDSGLLFLRSIDRKTLGGREWRRRVVAAPQFHENHTFAGSLAYNLLLGRGWPPDPEDLQEAEMICRELGLGPLLDSMPAGLMQMVGDTGWQLSNGEKSRVYLARALLQRSDLVILDESFAALDPETAHRTIDCVLKRAPALVCVAHV